MKAVWSEEEEEELRVLVMEHKQKEIDEGLLFLTLCHYVLFEQISSNIAAIYSYIP